MPLPAVTLPQQPLLCCPHSKRVQAYSAIYKLLHCHSIIDSNNCIFCTRFTISNSCNWQNFATTNLPDHNAASLPVNLSNNVPPVPAQMHQKIIQGEFIDFAV